MVNIFLSNIRIQDLFGKVVDFKGPMNGGKSKGVYNELKRANYSGFGFLAVNSALNSRDGANISIDGGREGSIRALSAMRAGEIREHFIAARDLVARSRGRTVDYQGLTLRTDLPLKVVAMDEKNLFCLDELAAAETLEFLQWAKSEGLYTVTSGLEFDFRQEAFAHVRASYRATSFNINVDPVCQALVEEQVCGSAAIHSQRIWSRAHLQRLGLGEFIKEDFGHANKAHEKLFSGHVAAPYFDKTVYLEDEANGSVGYIPVCDSCSELPFKEKTHDLYAQFRGGLDEAAVAVIRAKGALENGIVDFLLNQDEGWVRNDGGLFVPVSYHKNRIGTFSRV
ncbi:hypothetical protein HOC01_03455 [archaeon]|nr:hypothetical protein [archaeon]MBT6698532.1 hypothetical protein [archaeon]